MFIFQLNKIVSFLFIFSETPPPFFFFFLQCTPEFLVRVSCGRRSRRCQKQTRYKRIRNAWILRARGAYRRIIFRFCACTVRAGFEPLERARAQSSRGASPSIFPLQVTPPSSPSIKCERRSRRSDRPPAKLAPPPPLPRSRIKFNLLTFSNYVHRYPFEQK